MLHNHLRNFTSHELLVDLYSTDQSYNGTYRVDQLCERFEVARNHLCSFRDTRRAVALSESARSSGYGGSQDHNFLFHIRLRFLD